MDPEGTIYEREAIVQWLSTNRASPVTKSSLTVSQLKPCPDVTDAWDSQDFVLVEASSSQDTKDSRDTPFMTSIKITTSSDNHALVQISVSDDNSTSHEPKTIICVLDVSGSMSSPAVMHGDKEGSAGLSLLDVVKHATRTVIQTLSPQDKLAVVAYQSQATLLLSPTLMTSEGKAEAWRKVNALSPGGGTNLWDGLLKAMELAQLEESEANIILLTDGLPNIHPPRGELETLCRYQDKHGRNANISTFGFGYSIQSQLLRDIAVEGKGHYCYIPDSSFVGTVFVNATANILATALPTSTLSLLPRSSSGELEDHSGLNGIKTSWGISIDLPPLIYGQTLDILVKTKGPIEASLKNGNGVIICASEGRVRGDSDALEVAKARSKVVQFISEEEHTLSENHSNSALSHAQKNLKEISHNFLAHGTTDKMKAIQRDFMGQIQEAYSRSDWHSKWGRHYVLSLARAYVLQQCTNFKDPGVQIYATRKFSLIRDEAEEIFIQLPPPKPSIINHANHVPVRSMRGYYNSSNPCFARGTVKLLNGAVVDISELQPGDSVMSSLNGPSKIKCIIKTFCENRKEDLVELDDGVLVTPWHPIRPTGSDKWLFPVDLAPSVERECEAVFSFVLEGSSYLEIGYFEGVALGHGISNDPVASHAYLGTTQVISDLSKMNGWGQGYVTLGPNPCIRKPEGGVIFKIHEQPFLVK